jgi:hypothetical protein
VRETILVKDLVGDGIDDRVEIILSFSIVDFRGVGLDWVGGLPMLKGVFDLNSDEGAGCSNCKFVLNGEV